MHMREIVNKLMPLVSLCAIVFVSACDVGSSVFINDTGERLFMDQPAAGKCRGGYDYLDAGDKVVGYCKISELKSIKLADAKGNICNVDMADFRSKIKVETSNNAYKSKSEVVYLSQLNCPKLGLPRLGVPENPEQ